MPLLLTLVLLSADPEPALEAPCPERTTVLPQPQPGCRASPWLRVARVAVEVVLGTGLSLAGELLGAYAGLNVDLLSGREAGLGASLGAAVGAILTAPAAVWLGGRMMGGDGSFGWTVLGGAAGTAVAAGIIGIKNTTVAWAFAAAMPVLGAVLGYELSSHRHRSEAPAPAVGIAPALGPTSIGVVGVFP
ncbi:MAG: hypothetical protein JNK82_34675 [Myxococcaceae bacterium]|nr:hypothetical protein [Myxococcaceae bacterium]